MLHNTSKRRQARRYHRQTKWVSTGNSVDASPRPRTIRVFIADKHEVIRAGMRTILQGERDLEVVGEADNADGMLTELQRAKPDVILLESGLPGGSETDMCQRLFGARPSARIISVMRDDNDAAFRRAVEAGAQGYLRKNTSRVELVRAIRIVATGGFYLGPDGADQTFRLLRHPENAVGLRSGLHTLSPQERRIIPLIAEGNTNKEIAVALNLSEKTVRNYIANMFVKLEIERRTQAVALYLNG